MGEWHRRTAAVALVLRQSLHRFCSGAVLSVGDPRLGYTTMTLVMC